MLRLDGVQDKGWIPREVRGNDAHEAGRQYEPWRNVDRGRCRMNDLEDLGIVLEDDLDANPQADFVRRDQQLNPMWIEDIAGAVDAFEALDIRECARARLQFDLPVVIDHTRDGTKGVRLGDIVGIRHIHDRSR